MSGDDTLTALETILSPQAREAARLAAEKAGIPVSSWIERTVMDAATDQLRHSNQALIKSEPPVVPSTDTSEVIGHLDRLARKIDDSNALLDSVVAPFGQRIDRLEMDMYETKERTLVEIGPLQRKLAQLADRVRELEERVPAKRGR